ncbi:hypothetical protein [Vibrio sp. DNB22_19_1]
MPNTVVLLVHGMGTHPANNMKDEFKAGLTEAATGFGVAGFDPEALMELHEFNYSKLLDDIRKDLAETGQNLIELFPDGTPGASIIQQLIQFHAELDEDKFIYTHWLDVAMYVLLYGQYVRVELASKLNEIYGLASSRDVIVVAHSLGTALLHDTIDQFYKNPNPGEGHDFPHLRTGTHKLKAIWTVANVSKLVNVLNRVAEDKPTLVHSGSGGCTSNIYNVYHRFDPFCLFKPYNKETIQIAHGKHFKNEVVRIKNTHSFQEYIAYPDVAKFFIESITYSSIDDDKYGNYVEAHKSVTPDDLYEDMEAKFNEIKNGRASIRNIKELFELIKDFMDAVEDIWEDDPGDGGA